MRISHLAISAALFLAGCGGGGGGSAGLISEWLGTDPNAVVTTSSGATFDLRHGTADPNGMDYANHVANGRNYIAASQTFGGITLCGSSCILGPTMYAPHNDVVAAWRQGWTGASRNILLGDYYSASTGNPPNLSHDNHGVITATLASTIAPGAEIYGIDQEISLPQVPTRVINRDGSFMSLTSSNLSQNLNVKRTQAGYYFDVVNLSLGHNYWADDITNPTQQQVADAFNAEAQWTSQWAGFLNGSVDIKSNYSPLSTISIYATDAVVTKAAGNDGIATDLEPLSYRLAHDSVINPNLLIVGGLQKDGSVSDRAGLYADTNIAGTDPAIQSRFLLANAYVYFEGNSIFVNGVPLNEGFTSGTSFAAPRVAGYAAILRQKFPNLTAANTADILLQTARYDTLACYPNCDKAIYGQGEASLSHALSPVGALR